MTGSPKTWNVGDKVRLPDGPYGAIEKIEPGREFGEDVLYVTVGGTTRWVCP